MSATQFSIGKRLQELRRRAGLSMDAVAKAAGYAGASSVQAFFSDDYDPFGGLEAKVARRLSSALVGRGSPPIREDEIVNLMHFSPRPTIFDNDEISAPLAETPTLRGQPKDVPVYGTALGADINFAENGAARSIELTTVAMGEVLAYVRRPPGIDADRRVYAVFVVGSSMEPRYRAGDPVFVDPRRPPSIGDDVIVQIADRDESGGPEFVAGLIKTLARRSSTVVDLEQYNPGIRFSIPAERVAAIHRIIPWRECFGI